MQQLIILKIIKAETEIIIPDHNEVTVFHNNNNNNNNNYNYNNINNNNNNINKSDIICNDEIITIIIFEFDSTLCTQYNNRIKKLKLNKNNWEQWYTQQSETQLKLLFGGDERIKELNKFYKLIYNSSNNDLKCFCLTDLYSKIIIKLLRKIELNKYFQSKFGKKVLTHVIGCESKLYKENGGDSKKHLLILTLLKYLDRTHNQLLYISNNKNVIKQLNDGNFVFCKTYQIDTNGLTNKDLDNIYNKYFKK